MSGRSSRRSGIAFAPCAVAAALAALLAMPAQAQLAATRAPSVEVRADLLAARETTVHGGAAVLWPVGRSVRLGVQAGGGVTRLDGVPAGSDETVGSGRAELVAQFELDPFAAQRWGLYGSAGGGVLAVKGRSGRALVFATVGVERRTGGRVVPALEVGLGGGVRVALVLRRR